MYILSQILISSSLERCRTVKFSCRNYVGLDYSAPEPYFHQVMQALNQYGETPPYAEQNVWRNDELFQQYLWITLSTIIFINNFAQQRRSNLVFVLEKATDGQPINKSNFKFQMWIKLRNNATQLFFQCKIWRMIIKVWRQKRGFLLAMILGFVGLKIESSLIRITLVDIQT